MDKGESIASTLSLKQLIEASSVLCGQKNERQGVPVKDGEEKGSLTKRLKWRLETFSSIVNASNQNDLSDDIASLQARTGQASLYALQSIHYCIIGTNAQISGPSAQPEDVPRFGSRDLQTIKTLIGIVNSWRLGLQIAEYDRLLSQKKSTKNIPKLEEIKDEDDASVQDSELDFSFSQARSSLWNSLSELNAILNDKRNSKDLQILNSLIVEACSVHILAGGIRIGWGPAQISTSQREGSFQQDDISTQGAVMVSQLLKSMPTSTCLKTISAITRIGKTLPFIKQISETLFSAQLIRPDGVMALLRNTFASTNENEERGMMKKLVSVGHLLTSPPSRMPLKVFASIIVPRLLEVLGQLPNQDQDGKAALPSLQSSQAQKNAACFALTRLYDVIPSETFALLCSHVLRFINPSLDPQSFTSSDQAVINESQLKRAIQLIAEIVDQSEPSSKFASQILEKIAIQLFVLYSFVKEQDKVGIQSIKEKGKQKQADQLADTAYNLLITWLRLSTVEESMKLLSPTRKGIFGLANYALGTLSPSIGVADALCPKLVRDELGSICIKWDHSNLKDGTKASLAFKSLSLSDLHPHIHLSQGSTDAEQALSNELLNAFKLIPSPEILAQLLKRSERKDVASSVLVNILDAYTFSKSKDRAAGESDDVMLEILYVQHILQLIDVFGTEILKGQPEKILIFIAYALGAHSFDTVHTMRADNDNDLVKMEEDEEEIPFIKPKNDTNSTITNLLNVSSSDPLGASVQGESTIETSNSEEDEEMIETALNLLLSLLEGDTKMTFESHSMLQVIQAKVNSLTNSKNESIRRLAKEASLVLKARNSATEAATHNDTTLLQTSLSPTQKALKKGNEMYQEALKLLQDPILPVRAHGLVVLKQLVSHGTVDSMNEVEDGNRNVEILMDSALIPAILDIFIQAIYDDESFLYLNAVKGLAEMANAGGKRMIQRLISIYLGGDETYSKSAKALDQLEIDKRLRIGEALLQVIQKLDLALAAFTQEIVYPLLNAIRQKDYSTTYRSSMLSILGTCIEACPNAMAIQGHAKAICDGMLDLLSVEMDTQTGDTKAADTKQVDDALSVNSKLPQLRRAALLLLSLLIRGSSLQLQTFQQDRHSLHWQDELPQISQLRMPGGGSISPIKITSTKSDKAVSSNHTLLFVPDQIQRTERSVGYIGQFDCDALTQHQAGEVLQDLETFKLYIVHSSIT